MLILIKTKDGFDKAIKINNVEFEAKKDPANASLVNVTFFKDNGEPIEASMDENKYEEMINELSNNRELIRL